MVKKYDIAVSYAKQRREYVTSFVYELEELGMHVFFDQNPDCQARLLGEDLTVELDNIYRKGSSFCVMFICEYYANRPWTRYEQLILRARRFSESKATVLPCRFDDTELPGLQPTIGFVNVSDMEPSTLANLIHTKLKARRSFDFNSFYAMHAQGEYKGAIEYLKNIFERHYSSLSPKKRIWMSYNLACSYSRLAQSMNSDEFATTALEFFDHWLKDIIACGKPRYAECLNQFNADDDLLYLRTTRSSEIELLVTSFHSTWRSNKKATGQNISRGCFPKGTFVDTPVGPKEISEINVGDQVYSFDPKNKAVISTKVSAVFENSAKTLFRINDLLTTTTQPLFVQGRGWVYAIDIAVGDTLLARNGEIKVHRKNEVEADTCEVYHIETNHDTHNYFVHGVLVHNKMMPHWLISE